MTTTVDVSIVGGGPAGLMLGLLLAKRGVRVLVLEGHETFEREFRGEVLQPSTAHLLDELGLLDYILSQPHSRLQTGQLRLDGEAIGAVSFERIAPEHPFAIWMPQPVFLAALLRKAEPFPGFGCWMGARVTALVQDGGVTTGVTGTRHGGEPFEVHADVVVGADGRYSALAKMGGFAAFADGLTDLTPFFPLEGVIRLVDDWARDGLLLIGDAAHTMGPVGAIGVNVAIATAAVTAQVVYPLLGRGPIARRDLQAVQRLREADVRMLHRLQLRAQQGLLRQSPSGPLGRRVLPWVLKLLFRSPLVPRIQRRLLFGAPLPPLDPAFTFR